MIYLDHGATSFWKPPQVSRGICKALHRCANPGRGGYPAAMEADREVYRCRERAAALFDCQPEQVVFTSNCTHGLNIALASMVKPGSKIVISGFEHNAVTRPLRALGAEIIVAGRRLFDWDNILQEFSDALKQGADGAVFTHVSNVYGYILPVEELAELCRKAGVPFVVDAAQSGGSLQVSLARWGADFIAMPGHKGLLGPQGTGLLLCAKTGKPLLYGGTGTDSICQDMPQALPERLEAGTLNVPGIAGLSAGLDWILKTGTDKIARREHWAASNCAQMLKDMGFSVFSGSHQAATVSFIPGAHCEEFASQLAQQGIAVRAGLHCAPLAHESGGSLATGTVRVSFGPDACANQLEAFRQGILRVRGR